MFCGKCGNEFYSGSTCPRCGYDIKKKKVITGTTKTPKTKIPKQTKTKVNFSAPGKRKKMNKTTIITISVVATLLIAAGIIGYIFMFGFIGTGRESDRLIEYIDSREFGKAYDYYQDKIADSVNEIDVIDEFQKQMDDRYDAIIDEFNSGDINKSSMEKLDRMLDSMMEIALSTEKHSEFVYKYTELYQSKTAYEEGEKNMESKDYAGAVTNFASVISTDNNYDKAQKEKTNAIKKLVDGCGDYDKAISTLENYEEMLSSSEYESLKKSIMQYVIDSINEQINQDIESGDYKKAKSYVEEMLEKYPDNSDISYIYEGIEDYYRSASIDRAKKYYDAKEYSKAASTIKAVKDVLGDEDQELNELYKEYHSYAGVYLDEMDVFYKTGGLYTNYELEDNTGGIHKHACILRTGEAQYLLNGMYSSMDGVLAVGDDSKSTQENVYYEIYGDDTLLYTSETFTGGVLPQNFSINVSGVNILKIVVHETYYNSANYSLSFFDTKFTR